MINLFIFVIPFFCSLCPHHYHEHRAKTIAQSSPSPEPEELVLPEPSPPPPPESVILSSSRKRRRPNSPSNHTQTYSSTFDAISKSSVPKPNRRLSIAVIPATVDIEHPNKGDIIQMENGSRKKFDGVVWRTICSIPGCLIAAQRNELCRKHFIKLNGKPNSAPTMAMNMIGSGTMGIQRTNSTSSIDEESGIEKKRDFTDLPLRQFVLETHMTKNEKDVLANFKEESMDYDDNQPIATNFDNVSNSYSVSDDETHTKHEQSSSPTTEDNLGTQIDHTLINALSASREKFPTSKNNV